MAVVLGSIYKLIRRIRTTAVLWRVWKEFSGRDDQYEGVIS